MSRPMPRLPWMAIGADVSQAKSAREAQTMANLDWKVIEAPIYTHWGIPSEPDHEFKSLKAEGFKAIVRGDTHDTLAVHSNSYVPTQNTDIFDLAEALAGVGAEYGTAGFLGKGERVWTQVRIPQADFSVGNGDNHQSYLTVITSHDGSTATKAFITTVRIVCENTYQAALRSAKGQGITIKHTKSAPARIELAKKMLDGGISTAMEIKSKFERLANVQITKDQFFQVVDKLFPKPDETNKAANTRRLNVLEEILASYATQSYGFTDQRGSAFNLLNAITDYTDHIRGTRVTDGMTEDRSRAESAMFGSGSVFKQTAMDTIMETVTGNVIVPVTTSLLDQIIG